MEQVKHFARQGWNRVHHQDTPVLGKLLLASDQPADPRGLSRVAQLRAVEQQKSLAGMVLTVVSENLHFPSAAVLLCGAAQSERYSRGRSATLKHPVGGEMGLGEFPTNQPFGPGLDVIPARNMADIFGDLGYGVEAADCNVFPNRTLWTFPHIRARLPARNIFVLP